MFTVCHKEDVELLPPQLLPRCPVYDTILIWFLILFPVLSILWRWNISQRYNRHFNGLFNKRPSLLEFVQIVEKESRFQDQKFNNMRYGRRKEVEREERTILVVPVAYSDFLNLVN